MLTYIYLNVDECLENVNSEKLLCVIIDKHLSWKHHIDKTAKTLSENIALIKRIWNTYPTRPD